MPTKFKIVNTNPKQMQLILLSKIIDKYNSYLYKYTNNRIGRIPKPVDSLDKIDNKKYITFDEYIRSKPVWKQILNFVKETDFDYDDYFDIMIKNWKDISVKINQTERKIPIPSVILSLKMVYLYEKYKKIEENKMEVNRHLALKQSSDFNRLSPSLQSNINSLFKLKNINPDLSYQEVIQIFSGEFESDFADIIKTMSDEDITPEFLSKKFIC